MTMQVGQGIHDLSYRASRPQRVLHTAAKRNFGGVPFEKLMWGRSLISDKVVMANQAFESQICWGLPTFKLPPRLSKFKELPLAAPSLPSTCTVSPKTGRSQPLPTSPSQQTSSVSPSNRQQNDYPNQVLFLRQGTRRDAPRFLRHLPVQQGY